MTTVLAKVWSPCFVMTMTGSLKCQGNRHVSDETFVADGLDGHDGSVEKPVMGWKEMALTTSTAHSS
jgi:hypothetical protein